MNYLKIGVIVNTHGLRGQLKVLVTSDEADKRYQKNKHVWIKYQNEMKEMIIASVVEHKGMLLVSFKGYDNINDVECFKGCECYVDCDSIEKSGDDEAYYYELLDSKVYNEEHELLGVVVEILESSANVILRVEGDKYQFLLPFVDAFIISFDKVNKVMMIKVIEGLYEN